MGNMSYKNENMSQLIPVTTQKIGNEEVNSVNARELHKLLEVGKDFSTWVKGRIEKFGFIEDLDFSPLLGKSSGGQTEH